MIRNIQKFGGGLMILLLAAGLIFSMGVFWGGCKDDSGDEPVGTSIIQGNVESFEIAGVYFVPTGQRNLWGRVVSGICGIVVPSAYAGQAGIFVYLEGPVERVTMTDDDGSFMFAELPAGEYQLRFEYNGQEVTYRAQSGQTASITLEDNQMVEMTGIRISGGHVNIGNIRVLQLNESGQPIEPEPEPSEENDNPADQSLQQQDFQLNFSQVSLSYILATPEELVIRTEDEWSSFTNRAWQMIFSFPPSESDTVPPCNFSTHMIAAIFFGESSVTRPYPPSAREAILTETGIKIHFESVIYDGPVGYAFSYPYVAVCLPKSELPITWIGHAVEYSGGPYINH